VSARELAESAVSDVLDSLSGGARGTVVDSPPGAGKSTLVVRAAVTLSDAGERLIVVAQTNEQVDDLVVRLAIERPDLSIGRLTAQDYRPPARIGLPNVTVSASASDLGQVVLTTAAKLAVSKPDSRWPWAIIDEAYQMRSDLLLRIAGYFERALFVGDPGQLDPFTVVDTERWHGLSWDPVQSAVAVLLRHNPDMPVYSLPVSWRLPASAAPVVSSAFYPFTGFSSATSADERSLQLLTRPLRPDCCDDAVETAAASGWAMYELPARHTLRTDSEAVAACVLLAARVLSRGAVAVSERAPGGSPVTASRVAIGAAHRDQVVALRRALDDAGLDGVVADTANRLQGREFDVVIVLHPLSGRRDATAFHLEAGRLCVLASRHRHACIMVARAGIPELLDAHPSAEPVHLNVPVKFPDGWEANQALLSHLSRFKVRVV